MLKVSSVSFGKKIPLTRCQIFNNKSKQFVGATFYELDAQDITDAYEIEKAKGLWNFKKYILKDINDILVNRYPDYFKRLFPQEAKFYIMQPDDGETVGMMKVMSDSKNYHVIEIESNPLKKYKYVGQNMLASLSQNVLSKKGKAIFIDNPLESALNFYDKKCGFNKNLNGDWVISRSQMRKLIKNTQDKTCTKLIDLSA